MMKLSNNNKIIFIICILFLLIIPIYTVRINGVVLKEGAEYIFEVEAFDPYDMFRGNYLNIGFKENSVFISVSDPKVAEYGLNNYSEDEFYITIKTRTDGFAYFDNISNIKPSTDNYLKASGYYNDYNAEFIVNTPTRYYMNEKKSTLAEEVYNENIDNSYVKVKVKNGVMVIVGIYVNDVLIDTIE